MPARNALARKAYTLNSRPASGNSARWPLPGKPDKIPRLPRRPGSANGAPGGKTNHPF